MEKPCKPGQLIKVRNKNDVKFVELQKFSIAFGDDSLNFQDIVFSITGAFNVIGNEYQFKTKDGIILDMLLLPKLISQFSSCYCFELHFDVVHNIDVSEDKQKDITNIEEIRQESVPMFVPHLQNTVDESNSSFHNESNIIIKNECFPNQEYQEEDDYMDDNGGEISDDMDEHPTVTTKELLAPEKLREHIAIVEPKIMYDFDASNTLTEKMRRDLVTVCCNYLVNMAGSYPVKEEKIMLAKSMVELFPCLRVDILYNNGAGFLVAKLKNLNIWSKAKGLKKKPRSIPFDCHDFSIVTKHTLEQRLRDVAPFLLDNFEGTEREKRLLVTESCRLLMEKTGTNPSKIHKTGLARAVISLIPSLKVENSKIGGIDDFYNPATNHGYIAFKVRNMNKKRRMEEAEREHYSEIMDENSWISDENLYADNEADSSKFEMHEPSSSSVVTTRDLLTHDKIRELITKKYPTVLKDFSQTNILSDKQRRDLITMTCEYLVDIAGSYPVKEEKVLLAEALKALFPSLRIEQLYNVNTNYGYISAKLKYFNKFRGKDDAYKKYRTIPYSRLMYESEGGITTKSLKKYLKQSAPEFFVEFEGSEKERRKLVTEAVNFLIQKCGVNPNGQEKKLLAYAIVDLFPCLKCKDSEFGGIDDFFNPAKHSGYIVHKLKNIKYHSKYYRTRGWKPSNAISIEEELENEENEEVEAKEDKVLPKYYQTRGKRKSSSAISNEEEIEIQENEAVEIKAEDISDEDTSNFFYESFDQEDCKKIKIL